MFNGISRINKMKREEIDIIVPVSLELDWPTCESIVSSILEQYHNYGIDRFALACPGPGWRSYGYPPKEVFENLAELFLKVKNSLSSYPIECGWWLSATLKSGHSDEFLPQVKSTGETHPFSNCPLDLNFRKKFTENVAAFVKIAKPYFIITEDDYSIRAADGCFCKHHLEEFAKREGKYYSREELLAAFETKKPEALELMRRWRKLMKDSLVGLGADLRKAVDEVAPQIPIGSCQAGSSDFDGDLTLDLTKAFAGENHTPFSRVCGAFYGGVDTKAIPERLYHALYTKQHINCDFDFYHESDTFPHTRFFTSGSQMRALVGAAYSYGFAGSLFQTQQLLDNPNEEKAFGKMIKEERNRFNEVKKTVKQCKLNGVKIDYDPFFNTVDVTETHWFPLWVRSLSSFGIPHTTLDSDVVFWDKRQARYYDDEAVMNALSKGLFLDGEAALELCKRGYGKYIGVEIGDDVTSGNKLIYDLGAREVICEKFCREGKGKNMPSAHMLSPNGNGKMLKMTVTDEKCEVITEFYTFQKELVTPSMTRFENSLGGKVVVLAITLDNNRSQSLFNYRRQRLLQEQIKWCNDKFVFAKEEPNIYLIENEAVNPNESGFEGMLTLINLGEDSVSDIELHIPQKWKGRDSFFILAKNAEWKPMKFQKTADGIVINEKIDFLSPVYILVK